MTRLGALVLALAVTLPANAQAQRKPSNSMQTRSAEVYINNARGTNAADEKRAQLEKALGVLNEGTEKDADNPRVWFLLGQVHAMLGNAADADAAFDRAEELYPDYAKEIAPFRFDVWAREYNAGIAAIQANDMAGAIAKFESADAVYRAIRRDGTQKAVIDRMQTRDELYEVLGYHAYEQKLDRLFAEQARTRKNGDPK